MIENEMLQIISDRLISWINDENRTQYFHSQFTSCPFVKMTLEHMGFKDNDDYSQNGWEPDWSMSMTHSEKGTFNFWGSGYDGGCSITKET